MRRAFSPLSARRFLLIRTEDLSGISGTGVVAEGIAFSTGKIALAWIRPPFAIGIFDSVFDMMSVHGHQGKTNVHWVDDNAHEEGCPQISVTPQVTLGQES